MVSITIKCRLEGERQALMEYFSKCLGDSEDFDLQITSETEFCVRIGKNNANVLAYEVPSISLKRNCPTIISQLRKMEEESEDFSGGMSEEDVEKYNSVVREMLLKDPTVKHPMFSSHYRTDEKLVQDLRNNLIASQQTGLYWVSAIIQDSDEAQAWLCSLYGSCLTLEEAMQKIQEMRLNRRVLSAWVELQTEDDQMHVVFHECYVNALGQVR